MTLGSVAGRRVGLAAGASLFALVWMLLAVVPAAAIEPRSGDAVVVAAGETVDDDLAAAGTMVRIDGHVTGDVYVLAQQIVVGGTIDGDLIGAGQTVTIGGTVAGNVRVAGSNVALQGAVGRNVLAAAQTLQLTNAGRVAGSWTGAGSSVSIAGPVGRALTLAAGDVWISAPVGGGARLSVDELTIAPPGRIAGDLEYWSESEAALPSGAVGGTVAFHQQERRTEPEANAFDGVGRVFSIVWLVGTILVAIGLVLLVPRAVPVAAREIADRPIQTFAIGLGGLVMVPLAAIVVAFTVIGLPLTLIGLGLWVVAIVLGWPLAATALAALAARFARRDGRPIAVHPLVLAVVGVVVLWLVQSLPVIGGLIGLVAVCLGLGLEIVLLWRLRRAAPAPDVPTAVILPDAAGEARLG